MTQSNATLGSGLSTRTKLGYALGDHTLNLSLSALTLFYLKFLTETIGLDVRLAGLVFLIGRFVDAFTDPIMGRISDATKWKAGRRRPYFLIGAIPFGLSFALLWRDTGFDGQTAQFLAYCTLYILFSVSSTILAVPYLSLLPELAPKYHERTTLSTYRSVGAVLGTLIAAVAIVAMVDRFGGGQAGHAAMGAVIGIWLTVPWLLVFLTTYERPEIRSESQSGLLSGMKALAQHGSYRKLVGLYLFARMAVDLTGTIFAFYFAYWIARPEDLPSILATLLISVIVALPIWLKISRFMAKRTLFIFGIAWWIAFLVVLFFAQPDWPRWTLYAIAVASGAGYAVADMLPWSMLGDVIDEDELRTGVRREGIYSGFFMFVRKLGGGLAIFLIGMILNAGSFQEGASSQPESALITIRCLTALGPALLLMIAALHAFNYPLSPKAHTEIMRQLTERREARTRASE